MQEYSEVCAVGRWIFRHDAHAGLNWQTPCDRPVVDTIPVGRARTPVGLCKPHGDVIFDQIGKTFF